MKELKLEKLRSSEENGLKSPEIIFDKAKEKNFKRQMIVKSIILILLSNIFLFISMDNNKEIKTQKMSIDLSNYESLSLNLKNRAILTGEASPITILDERNNRVIEKAYLLKQIENDNSIDETERYLVAVNKSDLVNIVKNKRTKLYSYPYFKNKKVIKKYKRGPYEIIF